MKVLKASKIFFETRASLSEIFDHLGNSLELRMVLLGLMASSPAVLNWEVFAFVLKDNSVFALWENNHHVVGGSKLNEPSLSN